MLEQKFTNPEKKTFYQNYKFNVRGFQSKHQTMFLLEMLNKVSLHVACNSKIFFGKKIHPWI